MTGRGTQRPSPLAGQDPPEEPQGQRPIPQKILSMDQAMASHIRRALEASRGKVAGRGGAAELLGMNEGTLRFRRKKLGVGRGDMRSGGI